MAIKTKDFLDIIESDVATNPSANTKRVYFKTDHKLYYRDDSGAEVEVGEGGGTGGSGYGGLKVVLQTTDDTEANLISYALGDDVTATVLAIVTATKDDGSKQLSAVIAYSAYRDGAGAVELMGTNTLASNAWDEAVFQKCEFEVSGNDIKLKIQGAVGTTINWCVLYNVVTNTSVVPSANGEFKAVTDVNTATHDVADTDVCLEIRRTASGACQVNLPAISDMGSGRFIYIIDSGYNSFTNNITVARNGTDKINNVDGDYTMATSGSAITLKSNLTTGNWEIV